MSNDDAERRLIVNADDLGLAPGITRGILELAGQGAVTSASLMVNMPHSRDALAAAHAAGLDVGLHLNICAGAPLSRPEQVASLLQRDGRFASAGALARRRLRGTLRLDDVTREWCAQIEWLLEGGAMPSHLDSHCHLHAISGLHTLIRRLARRYGIGAVRRSIDGYILPLPGHVMMHRWARSSHRTGESPAPVRSDHFSVLTNILPAPTPRDLAALLAALPPGVHELVCHPGYVDDELRRLDPLTDGREREQLLLSSPLFRDTPKRLGVRLVSWTDIAADW